VIQSDFTEETTIIEEYLEEEYLEEFEELKPELTFVDPNIKSELKIESVYEAVRDESSVPSAILDHQYMLVRPDNTDDSNGPTSSEEEIEYAPDEFKRAKDRKARHKLRQLTGKAACKYCDTIFKSKDSLREHVCEFLQCDPKNFICRICHKELSKKTFSNHLHETLGCQYCGKAFVNPRNLKAHINQIHSDEKFQPPRAADLSIFPKIGENDETLEPTLDEMTGMLVTGPPRKKYPKKTGRFECDLCGRIFTTVRSLKSHMDLHTSEFR
jgi:hypothetical protein